MFDDKFYIYKYEDQKYIYGIKISLPLGMHQFTIMNEYQVANFYNKSHNKTVMHTYCCRSFAPTV